MTLVGPSNELEKQSADVVIEVIQPSNEPAGNIQHASTVPVCLMNNPNKEITAYKCSFLYVRGERHENPVRYHKDARS